MTNFDRLKPHFEALHGKGWKIEDYAEAYSAAQEVLNCEGCIVGLRECNCRMGLEFLNEDDQEIEWNDEKYNGRSCGDVIVEWLNEEVKQ
jgi:hypothetical protein